MIHQGVPPGPPLPVDAPHRWLLLALQLPASPTSVRVKTWRRLQQLGAVPIKNAVYVLPYSAQAVEDFAWLRTDVLAAGGQATTFAASSMADVEDAALVEQFRAARSDEYAQLLDEVRALAGPRRRGRADRLDLKAVRTLRAQFEQVRSRDFFAAPSARDVEAALAEAERAARPEAAPMRHTRAHRAIDPVAYKGRTWVTRPRPGVDRMACAWLITRFIDAGATFVFADAAADRDDAVAFDMYDDGFRHQDGRCTFEVMQAAFGIDDPAVTHLAELVHDVDLKDDRYRAADAPTVELLVDGLRGATADDQHLLAQGRALFDALYQGMTSRLARRARERKRR